VPRQPAEPPTRRMTLRANPQRPKNPEPSLRVCDAPTAILRYRCSREWGQLADLPLPGHSPLLPEYGVTWIVSQYHEQPRRVPFNTLQLVEHQSQLM
jgi:hypothetical protein